MNNSKSFLLYGVKFAESDYKDIISIALIIIGCILIAYFALFTGPNQVTTTLSTNNSIEATADNSTKDDSKSNENTTKASKVTKSPSKTPRKRTSKKKEEELGCIISPEGNKRSMRLKTRTPKKFDDDE